MVYYQRLKGSRWKRLLVILSVQIDEAKWKYEYRNVYDAYEKVNKNEDRKIHWKKLKETRFRPLYEAFAFL